MRDADDPSGNATIASGGFLFLRGWLLGTTPVRPVDSIAVGIEGINLFEAAIGFQRSDIRDAYGAGALTSGFSAAIPVDVPSGRYALTIVDSFAGHTATMRPSDTLTIGPPLFPLAGLTRRDRRWKFAVDGVFCGDRALAIDADGAFVVAPAGPVELRLWAIESGSLRPPLAVVARRGGTYLAVASGLDRKDIAAAVDTPIATRCGASIRVSVGPFGSEEIVVYAVGHDDTYSYLTSIRLKQPEPLPTVLLPLSATVAGAIDEVRVGNTPVHSNAGIHATAGQRVRLRGWALDQIGPRLSGGIEVIMGATVVLSGQTSHPRPDIAAQFGTAVSDCEFDVAFIVPPLKPGAHRLTVRGLTARRDATAAIGDLTVHIGQ